MGDAYTWVNATRAAHGLKRMKRGRLLERYAKAHSRKMALTYQGLVHGDPQEWALHHGGSTWWSYWGENIGATATEQADPIAALHKAFMASPDHRRNILRPAFRVMGIGLYRDDRGITWETQAFRS